MKVPDELAQHAAITLIDLSVGVAAAPATTRDRASAALQRAEASLKAKPDDLNARFARASACFELGDYKKAIDDLDAVIKKAPQVRQCLSAPVHRPCPPRSQGGSQGGPGPVPEERLGSEHEALSLGHRGRRAGRGSRPGVREAGGRTQEPAEGPQSRLQCRLRLRPGIASPWQERPGEASTAGGSGHRLAQSGNRRAATPISTTCRRTPTSTRSVASVSLARS